MSTFPIYDAVVSTDEKTGDYLLPSAALANGALNIFIRRGIYNETADVVIPVGATLTGEHRGLTIIDFGANAASLRCESGYLTVESTGTVELKSGSTEVVGTDTTFTNIAAGDVIQLFDNDFIVESVTDETTLILESPYNGRDMSGVAFSALLMRAYDQIKNFTIRNSTSVGLSLSGCRRFLMEGITISKCIPNIVLDRCSQYVIRNTISEYSSGVGVVVGASCSGTVSMFASISNVSHGMATTGDCSNLLFHDLDSSCNGGSGIYINGVFHDANFTNCVSRQNYEHGLYSNSASNSFVFNSSNVDSNGASGIESHGGRTIYTNNTLKRNVGTGLDMSGDDSIAGKNIGFENNDGIRVAGSRCNICDNSFTDSANDSIHIMMGADNNIVTGNHFEGAGNNTMNDEGTNTLTAGTNKP